MSDIYGNISYDILQSGVVLAVVKGAKMSPQEFSSEAVFPSRESKSVLDIKQSPEEIAEKFGVTFTRDGEYYDGLDWFIFAVRVYEGIRFFIYRHRGLPVPGTCFDVDVTVDTEAAIAVLVRAFSLTEDDIVWRQEEI